MTARHHLTTISPMPRSFSPQMVAIQGDDAMTDEARQLLRDLRPWIANSEHDEHCELHHEYGAQNVDAANDEAEQAALDAGGDERDVRYRSHPEDAVCTCERESLLARIDAHLSVNAQADNDGLDGIGRIAAERRRQIEQEGWTPEHDATHDRDGALPRAAACYALAGLEGGANGPFFITHLQTPQQVWPMRWNWKPKDRLRNLERAGALIAAEIDRISALSKGGDRG